LPERPRPLPKKTLLGVDVSSMFLDKKRSEIFHSVVTNLLYVATQARMDMLLIVRFLCTRVSKSTIKDENNLKRLLEYIKGTLDMDYRLGADDLTCLQSWVDSSDAVHSDMKSHTGGVTSFGTGGLLGKSTKQKLNTKSSTEAELVDASNYLPCALCTKVFMEAQGQTMSKCTLDQDNESVMKLEMN
jgi:hypothetical protein